MRVYLENVLTKLQTGNEVALLLDPKTVEEIILELRGMCQSTETITVEPRIGLSGFKISLDGNTLIYYVQNGILKAGYFIVEDEPAAPGL